MRFLCYTTVLVLVVTLLFIGCGKGSVLGKYGNENDSSKSMELFKNGKCLISGESFDYSVEGDTLLLTNAGLGGCSGKISGNTITFAMSDSNGNLNSCLLLARGKWVKK
jgi:hypothetical protein